MQDLSTFFDLRNRSEKLVTRNHWQLGLAHADRQMHVHLKMASFKKLVVNKL